MKCRQGEKLSSSLHWSTRDDMSAQNSLQQKYSWTGKNRLQRKTTEEQAGYQMKLTYKKLWKLLIDRNMNKRCLQESAALSPSTISKLSKGESVNTATLIRICETLDCDISDIAEVTNSDSDERAKENAKA